MTISLKHKFHSGVPQGSGTTKVGPNAWNDEHDLTMSSGYVLGRTSPGDGDIEEIQLSDFPTLDAQNTFADVNTFPGIQTDGAQNITVNPTGNTPDTLTSLSVQGSTISNTTREFLVNIGLTNAVGDSASSYNGDKVALYSGIDGQSGGGDSWAANFVAISNTSHGAHNTLGLEIDVVNENQNFTSLSDPGFWALSIAGAGSKTITGGILVSALNADQFEFGIAFISDCIKDYGIFDAGNETIGYYLGGTKTIGIDMSAMVSAYALHFNTGAVLAWNSGDYTLTHSAGVLTANKDFRITTPGTNSASAVTVGGTQTLTNKTLTAATLGGTTNLSGGQIAFPASQNASAGANTLDDYEEGTWTPALTFGGAAVGMTYDSQAGSYTKVGNAVAYSFTIDLSAKGSSTGNNNISGFPFTASTAATGAIDCFGMSGLTGGIAALLSGANFLVRLIGATGSSTATQTSFTDSSIIRCSGVAII